MGAGKPTTFRSEKMTFKEYCNQGDNPVYRPMVEITEEDIHSKHKTPVGYLINLEILGERFQYLLKKPVQGKKASNCLYVLDLNGDSALDTPSVFHWKGKPLF
jgi:hypothetical protein